MENIEQGIGGCENKGSERTLTLTSIEGSSIKLVLTEANDRLTCEIATGHKTHGSDCVRVFVSRVGSFYDQQQQNR